MNVATVQICSDPACTTVLDSAIVTGTSYTPTTALPQGVGFWQVSASTDAGSLSSPVWEFWVGAENAPVSTSWGTTLDVNLDGIADLATGTPGSAAVWITLGASPYDSIELSNPSSGAGFGAAVASAGDVNGDGYGDLIVSTMGLTGGAGANATYIYLGGPGFPGEPIVIPSVSGEVMSAGDVNGDGYADILVDFSGPGFAGAVLYLGSADGTVTSTSTGISAGEHDLGPLGAMGSGDFNGDGYADVYVGVVGGFADVAIYYGSATGLGATPQTFSGAASTATAAAVTDVNGDGYADLVVGLSGDDLTKGADVYYGGPDGLTLSSDTITPPSIDPAIVAEFLGGWDFLASAGDVNADGYGDIVVLGKLQGTTNAYVYLGSSHGLQANPVGVTLPADATGAGAVGAGDFNGDGYDDVAVAGTSKAVLVYPGVADGGVAATSFLTVSPVDGGSIGAMFGTAY